MSEFCRLPESELDVMLAVWKQGGEASAPEIGESLGRALTASALVSEADYRRAESGAVLEKLYGGSLKAFAAALWDGGRLSGDDVRDLRSYLEELERRDP